MSLYKINRATHRDLGYFFTAMTLIYAISGIALNHRKDWNPNYIIETSEHKVVIPEDLRKDELNGVTNILGQINQQDNYRKYYFPTANELKVFIKGGGSVTVNLTTGQLLFENLKKRPILFEINLLHYNPGKLWMWFSDIFCVALILMAISGLFILKGKNGITRRGAWLTGAGIIIPILFLLIYY